MFVREMDLRMKATTLERMFRVDRFTFALSKAQQQEQDQQRARNGRQDRNPGECRISEQLEILESLESWRVLEEIVSE